MTKNVTKLLATAMVVGLIAGNAAIAGNRHPKSETAKGAKKDGCKGRKDGCKGMKKDGCKGKKHTKKAAPAAEAPAAEAPTATEAPAQAE
jgi:hypothetical protein